MDIFSDAKRDVRSHKEGPGSYEWWYFDAVSLDERYSLVVIFYEGNPFSTRYNRALEEKDQKPMPQDYPAISISIYKDGNPIYYSFTEFEEGDCSFNSDKPDVKIGNHRMSGEVENRLLKYQLDLDEQLPSGDALKATIEFKSAACGSLFDHLESNDDVGHRWNLVQPRAQICAEIDMTTKEGNPQKITFEGLGYHDHNTGQEPMRNEFKDWYWGRFHFEDLTLVYYVMNRQQAEQHRAWLIDKENNKVLDVFEDIELQDRQLTLFGLHTARKLSLHSPTANVQIQQSKLLDNGPFYQRYLSDAFLQISGEQIAESQRGITEYIYPARIYAHIFWPFVDMRIRYTAEGSHWVQRSKTLYRWTW